MNFIQEEINIHKNKLMTLINNLINTQLINEEIFINNEIKKESECLISLLNLKQKELLNQMNDNNLFPFMPQPINISPININQMNMGRPQMEQNNFNEILNVKFHQYDYDKWTIIHCNYNEKISELIKKYREKANDFNENFFIYNVEQLKPSSELTLSEIRYKNGDQIEVIRKGSMKAGKL